MQDDPKSVRLVLGYVNGCRKRRVEPIVTVQVCCADVDGCISLDAVDIGPNFGLKGNPIFKQLIGLSVCGDNRVYELVGLTWFASG